MAAAGIGGDFAGNHNRHSSGDPSGRPECRFSFGGPEECQGLAAVECRGKSTHRAGNGCLSRAKSITSKRRKTPGARLGNASDLRKMPAACERARHDITDKMRPFHRLLVPEATVPDEMGERATRHRGLAAGRGDESVVFRGSKVAGALLDHMFHAVGDGGAGSVGAASRTPSPAGESDPAKEAGVPGSCTGAAEEMVAAVRRKPRQGALPNGRRKRRSPPGILVLPWRVG